MNHRQPDEAPQHAGYDQGYSPVNQERLDIRRVEQEAQFLLEYLAPGKDVLDCGCGPGAITLGVAQAVAPGRVVGVDREESQIARARQRAAEQGLENVSFEVGAIDSLPFEDDSFDLVYAHTVLVHLQDPLSVLREMRRVLRPDGVVAVRDPYWSSLQLGPANPLLDRFVQLGVQVYAALGARPDYARNQRMLLRQAGFPRNRAFADAVFAGESNSLRRWASEWEQRFRQPAVATMVERQGWADRETLEAMLAEVRAWGESPDGFLTMVFCGAYGKAQGPAEGQASRKGTARTV